MSIAGGLDFSYYKRNLFLQQTGVVGTLKTRKTGTTIVGICYADGVILGADTRATEGPIVADKNCEKIHYIAPNMYCCGAGTAADTEFVTSLISSRLALHRLNSRRESRVATAMTMLKQHLFRHQGHIGAALILGGIDCTGPHLYTVYPHGSVDQLPYVTMGSGSLAAISIFESGWRPGMTRDEGVALVASAIRAGIFNDLGSGSNVDVTVLARGKKAEILRNYQTPNERPPKEQTYVYASGTTPVISSTIKPLSIANVLIEETANDRMEA